MTNIQTNRDLYFAIAELIARRRAAARDLEEYLRALWAGAGRFRGQAVLTVDEFFGLLSSGFTLSAPPFDEAWRSRFPAAGNSLAACVAAKLGLRPQDNAANRADVSGFDGWEALVLRQIVDLREMAELGILKDEMRYFGIDAPRGSRWYNFDPCTFLECATAGSYGGWQSGDATGRDFVPGAVAVVGDDGHLTTADPQDVADPIVALREVSWEDFRSFLGCGQWYE